MRNMSQSKKSKLFCHAKHFAAAVISMRHAQALSSSLKHPPRGERPNGFPACGPRRQARTPLTAQRI
jgi:hypothetical protein